jgi:transposase
MTDTKEQELLDRISELVTENTSLRACIAKLEQQLIELSASLPLSDDPPAPGFVKPKRQKRRRRKPGRKSGHPGSHRQRATKADEMVEVPLEDCPHCHGSLENVHTCEQYVEEIIPAHTKVICYRTHKGYCPHCHRKVESRHPDQIPRRMIGSRALLTAAQLKHELGVPYRKTASVLKRLCGLSVTPGALVQQMNALAEWLKPEYEAIQCALRQSSSVNVDETGWRLDGKSCWLWAFTNSRFTIYEVNASRGHQVVLQQLGEDYAGTVISDFYTAYNPLPYSQQKCLVHLLRELSKCAPGNTEEYAAFHKKLTRLLRDSLRLKQRVSDLPQDAFDRRLKRIHQRLAKLAQATYETPDCQRLAKRLSKHGHQLFTFLEQMDVESDNNRAERAIRPAVVTRKISGGNRSPKGTKALGIITSVIQTCKLQKRDFVEVGLEIIRRYHSGLPAGILTDTSPAPT